MPQSLIQLPKIADFEIGMCPVIIRSNKVIQIGGLMGNILYIIQNAESDRNILYQFEEHGISFETAIEECARELEYDIETLGNFIYWNMNYIQVSAGMTTNKDLDIIYKFAESEAGKKIAAQFIEKIRGCNNWEEIYDELHQKSSFQKEMKNRIQTEIKQ